MAAADVPTERMYGSDVEPAFWRFGYELFKDEHKFKATFIPADILDEDASLEPLKSHIDIVWAGSVIHLWDWHGQLKALKAIIQLTRKGSMVAGAQLGMETGQEFSTDWKTAARAMFFHDADTFKKLWSQAAVETSTSWKVDARIVDIRLLLPESRDSAWMGDQARGLFFEAYRLPDVPSS